MVSLKHDAGVLKKVVHNVFRKPATVCILEIEWKIPMIESHDRFDAIFKTGIDEVVVVCECLFIL